MFGIKIISEREYRRLVKNDNEWSHEKSDLTEELYKKVKDCESLRQQLNDKMQEINKLHDLNTRLKSQNNSLSAFRRDTLEAMGQIDLAGFQLSYCTKKCEHCKREQRDCKKYKFGNHEYCVIPKQ